MRAIYVTTDDYWEGIYLDGKLVDQGHELGEGYNSYYLMAFAKRHGLKYEDFGTCHLEEHPSLKHGTLPNQIDETFDIEPFPDLDSVLE